MWRLYVWPSEELINCFPKGSIMLESRWQCWGSVPPHLPQYLSLSVFCILVISSGCEVVSLWFDLLSLTKDTGIFSCTCWPFVYLLWRRSIKSLCPFFNWVSSFLLLSCESTLYLLDRSLESDIWFSRFLSHFVSCLHFLDDNVYSALFKKNSTSNLFSFWYLCLCMSSGFFVNVSFHVTGTPKVQLMGHITLC